MSTVRYRRRRPAPGSWLRGSALGSNFPTVAPGWDNVNVKVMPCDLPYGFGRFAFSRLGASLANLLLTYTWQPVSTSMRWWQNQGRYSYG